MNYMNLANWYTELRQRKMDNQPGQLVYKPKAEEDELHEPGQLVYRAQAEEGRLPAGQLVDRAQVADDELQEPGQ